MIIVRQTLLLTILMITIAVYFGYAPVAAPIVYDETAIEHTQDGLTALEELILSMVEPEPPELECEMLVGDDQLWPNNPRPQIACWSDQVGMFFWSWYSIDADRYLSFDTSRYPSRSDTIILSTAADLRIAFRTRDGGYATFDITAENTLFEKHCIQPLCLRV